MKPKVDGLSILVNVIEKIVKHEEKTVVKNGKKVKMERDKFVRNARLRTWFRKNDIRTYGDYIDNKGRVIKTKCNIYDLSSGQWYNVDHSMDEIHEAINEIGSIGFKKN